jgi:hypothetical protein
MLDSDQFNFIERDLIRRSVVKAGRPRAAHPKAGDARRHRLRTVVVGEGAGNDAADVFGDTPNIAVCVQAAAEPGTVPVSAIHSAILGMFVVEDCLATYSKGSNSRYNSIASYSRAASADALKASPVRAA